ncbi:hypothetical protein ACEWY4_010805 [Coilia grayii]|uniref:BHLH domain-containing protein n=1 Tax=Coilia grayii TaxID=363190 RepID=A0ABD1K2Z2_9TELE
MDASSVLLGQNRVDVSSPVFSALGNSEGSWMLPNSDSWNSPPGDPWSYWTSDPEFSNISSPEMASPSSFCSLMDMSPHRSTMTTSTSDCVQAKQEQRSSPSTPSSSSSSSSSSCEESGRSCTGGQKDKRLSRTKYPGRKRQSASEREKLRMRDLTKALHHLRNYLPPSVAPEGQTLTKIQTLRLAIRYIAHLSAQLQQDCPAVTAVKMEQAADTCWDRPQPHSQHGCPQNGPAALVHCLQYQPSSHWSHHKEPYTHPLAKYTDLQQSQLPVTHCLASAVQQDMTLYQVRT